MFAVFSLSACFYWRHGKEPSSKQCDFVVSEPRTATDRMCTDAQCKRPSCGGAAAPPKKYELHCL